MNTSKPYLFEKKRIYGHETDLHIDANTNGTAPAYSFSSKSLNENGYERSNFWRLAFLYKFAFILYFYHRPVVIVVVALAPSGRSYSSSICAIHHRLSIDDSRCKSLLRCCCCSLPVNLWLAWITISGWHKASASTVPIFAKIAFTVFIGWQKVRRSITHWIWSMTDYSCGNSFPAK